MAPRSWSVSRLHLLRCAVGSGLGWPMRRCTAARQAGGAGRDVDAVRLGCRQAVRLPSGSAHHDSIHSAAAPCWPCKAFRGPRPRRAPPPPLDPLLPRSCGLTTTFRANGGHYRGCRRGRERRADGGHDLPDAAPFPAGGDGGGSPGDVYSAFLIPSKPFDRRSALRSARPALTHLP